MTHESQLVGEARCYRRGGRTLVHAHAVTMVAVSGAVGVGVEAAGVAAESGRRGSTRPDSSGG